MNRSLRLIAEFHRTSWGLLPETLAAMQEVLYRWASGGRLSQDEIRAAVGNRREISAARRDRARQEGGPGSIAVLPVYGVIGHRASLVEDSSSGVNTSTELLGNAFRALMADPDVAGIVLDVDSPGGSVHGIQELAETIFAARGVKPVSAVANSLAASAAYWIASCAEELAIMPGGEAGSIGIFAAHTDVSKMLEADGVKTTLVSAGKYKLEGNSYEPLGAEARDFIQSRVDEYYGEFVRAVARNRKDNQTAVRNGYGQGRVLGAQAAVKANLVDRVATLDQIIADMRAKVRGKVGARAKGAAMQMSALARAREIELLKLS
jgi:signal peptide peptidase SppA